MVSGAVTLALAGNGAGLSRYHDLERNRTQGSTDQGDDQLHAFHDPRMHEALHFKEAVR